MKHILIALSLLTILGTSPTMAQGKHRHKQHTVQVTSGSDTVSVGIDAYSDTTSYAGDNFADTDEDADSNDDSILMSHNTPVDQVVQMFNAGVGGMLIAVTIMFATVLFFLIPLIIVIVIVRYLLRRHKDNVMLAEKAMAAGQNIPERLKPIDKQDEEYIWRRGVKNAALGVGLIFLFLCLGAEELAGIGVLVMCMGIGKMVIGRNAMKKRKDSAKNGDDNDFDLGNL